MLEIVKSVTAIIALLMLFIVFGSITMKIMRIKGKGFLTIIVGFFSYYTVFEVVYLPFVLTLQKFSSLYRVWCVVCLVMTAISLIFCRKELALTFRGIWKNFRDAHWWASCFAVFMVGAVIWYQTHQLYWGWDTVYYIGTVNTTVYTDTMYVYEGENGGLLGTMSMKYAITGFYMQSVFWCRLLSAAAICIQKYTIGTLCTLLSAIVILQCGKRAFDGNVDKAFLLVGVCMILNFFFLTVYTTSDFLMYRSYEAKAYCTNVVLPGIAYAALEIWRGGNRGNGWKLLFIIGTASVSVSMSAILIAPVMIMIIALTEAIVSHRFRYVFYGAVSCIANGGFLIVYYLYIKGIWVVTIG